MSCRLSRSQCKGRALMFGQVSVESVVEMPRRIGRSGSRRWVQRAGSEVQGLEVPGVPGIHPNFTGKTRLFKNLDEPF